MVSSPGFPFRVDDPDFYDRCRGRRGGVQSERRGGRRRATPETVKLYERRIDPLPGATRNGHPQIVLMFLCLLYELCLIF